MTADRIFTQAYTVYLSKAKIQYLYSFMLRSQV